VFNLAEHTYPQIGYTSSALAGGKVHWVFVNGDAYGHNVHGISETDLRFSTSQAPGGVERSGRCINCHATLANAQSGCEGCHVPHHHADNNSSNVIGQENGWYRFLGSVMQRDDQVGPPPEGVIGIEVSDWEQNALSNRHNTYQGKPGPYTNYLETGSINQKCAGCHGNFHNETLANSVWIRHPGDAIIPDSGEFVSFTAYNPLVPVARLNVTSEDASFSTINRGSDMVSCISCHRAHGSPYPAMLRWGYRDWPGNDSYTQQPAINGCAVCHTTKD
ncbi:MAG: cytochrome c3 family protein, partial [Deltaproteobacteria bacterium]|nr:cytochrome c3 family protein [Deltaproteobacteria bacterium]